VFCSADARIGPNGELYGRSGDADCRFVDARGHVVTELGGEPICYDARGHVERGPECE
jgi:hypothetical protein